MNNASLPPVLMVLGTGGTIAGTAQRPGDAVGYRAAQLGIAALVADLPWPEGMALQAEQVLQLDSKDMGFAHWQQLARRCADLLAQPEVAGLVITHGTDTLEETAWLLHRVLDATKPVVLTCAMRPADAPGADGPANLRDALAVAADPAASGVLAVAAGRVHAARHVQKVHPYRIDAFDSGEAGPLGMVEEGRVRWLWPAATVRPASAVADDRTANLRALLAAADSPRVSVLLSHAGVDGALVDALLARGVDGIVAAGTGNGTLHAELRAALLRAVGQGVPVWRASRCALGAVVPGGDDALPDSRGLSPVKARIELLLELLRTKIA